MLTYAERVPPRLLRSADVIPAGLLEAAFDGLVAELDAPQEFPPKAMAEADAAAAGEPAGDDRLDRCDLEFVTLDPPGSMDLDQAMCLQRTGGGFTVYYAIADVPAFVPPEGALDAETRRRGQTLYLPHRRIPLHPPVLSEGAASLLPGQRRPAMVWTIEVDDTGSTTSARLERSWVRSRTRFAYQDVQSAVEAGRPPAELELLQPLGELLLDGEAARGGAVLRIPAQEIEEAEQGYRLGFRAQLPTEQWNAQISLLTGRAAADIMLAGRIGIVRTLPDPDPAAIQRLRRQSLALGVSWPDRMSHQEWLRVLDPSTPAALALAYESATLFRGAGYEAFDGTLPDQPRQAAIADEYAHVTAPLRRLVDRFGLIVCEALVAGREVPGWVRTALPELPALMRAADSRASAIERAVLDLAEAAVLSGRVGEVFDGVIVDVRDGKSPSGSVQLRDPSVVARVQGEVHLGDAVQVRLEEADLAGRRVTFALV